MAITLSPLLGFTAGALTIASPCVLPLVPIVLGNALQANRLGPIALSVGLVVSFTSVGLLVSSLNVSSGFDANLIAQIGAAFLVFVGLILTIPQAQRALTIVVTPLSNWANARQAGLDRYGLLGQAGIGVLLGLVWSPCVGPTLGAATILAAQSRNFFNAALVMFAFSLGVSTVLLFLALATRNFTARWQTKMLHAGQSGKIILGGLMTLVGILILTGGDHIIEGFILEHSPEWLTNLTTRF